jgi:hypothetical protein
VYVPLACLLYYFSQADIVLDSNGPIRSFKRVYLPAVCASERVYGAQLEEVAAENKLKATEGCRAASARLGNRQQKHEQVSIPHTSYATNADEYRDPHIVSNELACTSMIHDDIRIYLKIKVAASSNSKLVCLL